MRRVRFSVAMSLDGFIAGPKGEYDWIVMDPEIDFGKIMGSFDTILMGRKTYEASKGHQGGGMPGMDVHVISNTLSQKECPGVTVSNDPKQSIASIRALPGKDIWLFGGGVLFGELLSLGLVDSIEFSIIPVLLGEGLPILPKALSNEKLKLVKHHVYLKTGTVLLEYVPEKLKKSK